MPNYSLPTCLTPFVLAAGLALASFVPAQAAGCCGGGGGMMCGKSNKMDLRAGGMKPSRAKKAACCCEGMAGHGMAPHGMAPMSKKL